MGTNLQVIDRLVPGANLESYIQAASRIPVLSVEEERKLQSDCITKVMWMPPASWFFRICAS